MSRGGGHSKDMQTIGTPTTQTKQQQQCKQWAIQVEITSGEQGQANRSMIIASRTTIEFDVDWPK